MKIRKSVTSGGNARETQLHRPFSTGRPGKSGLSTSSVTQIGSPANRMPGNLLIRVENGRGAIPYGLNRNNINTMRLALTCIVTLIAVSVAVNGESEYYPGKRYIN